MFIQKAGYSIHIFEDNHIESVVNLLAVSFIKHNPVWRAYKIDYNIARNLIRFKVTTLTKQSISFVLKDQNSRIVGCIMNIDLCNLQSNLAFNAKNCIDSIKEIQQMELFQILAQVDLEFFQRLEIARVEPGSIYNYYVAIDESIKNQGLASYMYQATLNCLKLAGITNCYVRITNPITYKIMNKMGANELNRHIINVPEKGLHNYTTYFMHMSLAELKLQRECL